MKKSFILCLICVIFVCCVSVNYVYALNYETINFYYNNKCFTYNLSKNIKSSTQFDLNYQLNKYNRFDKNQRASLVLKMQSLGFDNYVIANYLFPNLNLTFKNIENNINVVPKQAKLTINENSEQVFYVEKEIIGIYLDKEKLYSLLLENCIKQKPLEIRLPTKQINPLITQKELEKDKFLLSDFSTNISSSNKDRKHNIKNALNSLNKIEIAPNQVFSFNKTIGRRSAENGYRKANIIINDEFVEGYGGGVCQVSSTLYNSALLAGMEILEANKHSKKVSYVKSGFDAMVNYGSSDLKFRNNNPSKITIISNYNSNKIRIRIFGEKQTYTYKLSNEIYNITEPIEEVKIDENFKHIDKVKYEDEYFYLKTASSGMEIKSYREKFIEGKLVDKELLRTDKYKVQNAIKIYGAKKRTDLLCA